MTSIEFYTPENQLIDTVCIKQKDLKVFLQEIDGYPLHIVKEDKEYYFKINKNIHLKTTQGCKKTNETSIIKATIQNDKDYLLNCEEMVEQSCLKKLDKLLEIIQ